MFVWCILTFVYYTSYCRCVILYIQVWHIYTAVSIDRRVSYRQVDRHNWGVWLTGWEPILYRGALRDIGALTGDIATQGHVSYPKSAPSYPLFSHSCMHAGAPDLIMFERYLSFNTKENLIFFYFWRHLALEVTPLPPAEPNSINLVDSLPMDRASMSRGKSPFEATLWMNHSEDLMGLWVARIFEGGGGGCLFE